MFNILIILVGFNICYSIPTTTGDRGFPKCKVSLLQVDLNFIGCRKTSVKLYGCGGYCKSDSTIQIYRDKIVPKCDCCKPRRHHKFYVQVFCPGNKKVLKFVPLLSALKCRCQPCLKHLTKK